MAGAHVLFVWNDKEVSDLLKQVAGRVSDLTPAMRTFGKYMVTATDDRFAAEKAPDGSPWKKLSPITVASKKKMGKINKILQQDGYLKLIHATPQKRGLTLWSNRKYAAIHQFGGPISKTEHVKSHWRSMTQAFGKPIPARSVRVEAHDRHMSIDIPKREFLGFSKADQAELSETIKDYILLGRP